ncbi:hypothetical protein FHX57_006254 [Paraburkholderia tropica]|nr:hypothetical protein [Paraburkholderia tropica]MBB6322721.1 hypothetical protein [Paraburkholderia tropica]
MKFKALIACVVLSSTAVSAVAQSYPGNGDSNGAPMRPPCGVPPPGPPPGHPPSDDANSHFDGAAPPHHPDGPPPNGPPPDCHQSAN